MRKILLTLCLLIINIIFSYGQNFEPLDLAQKIFVTGHFNSFTKYIKGEFRENDGHPNLNDFEPNLQKKFTLLKQTENKAVVAMTVTDSLQHGVDTYLHFEKDSIWKMVAFRGLALTGMIETQRDFFQQLTSQQVDSIIAAAQNKFLSSFFSSREEYEFEMGNDKLWLNFDDSIIAHFQKNKFEFNKLKDSIVLFTQQRKALTSLEQAYKKLFITAVATNADNFTNSIHFVIGGITDNVVGYVYINDKKDVPEMSPNGIIMLRSIGNGWYIYKTT